jgi:sec-independent protein translocase protein TatB
MSLGPEKIILILVVALIVFGPHRLPDIARQVGAAMRELRKMQDTVRDELEHVMHPDFLAPGSATTHDVTLEETDHAALPSGPASDMSVDPGDNGSTTSNDATDGFYTDDGFAGPRSFS